MTAAPLAPGPNLFSILSRENDWNDRARRETFLLSLLGQAAILALIVYLMSNVIRQGPGVLPVPPTGIRLPLIFSGSNGGGGGNHDPLPASVGNPPLASLDPQIVPPTVMRPTHISILTAPETVEVAPEVKLPQGGQIGDPMSKFAGALSDGPGGPGGMGDGCCDGIGKSKGPHLGDGDPGIRPAGRGGVGFPEAIYSPEPTFSDEARQTKTQGIVLLMIVVGKDGRPYDIHVQQSLGMGLDQKAIEAVSRWRFRPATQDGQPVATRIAVEVNFRLY